MSRSGLSRHDASKDGAECVRYRALPLTGVESMSARTARSFPRHTHDEFGIGLVDAGGHASWSGRGHVEAGPGMFITTNPGEVHDGRALGRGARSWRILYFEPGALRTLLADVTGTDARFEFTRPVFADPALRARFERAFAAADAMAGESALLHLVADLRGHSTASVRDASAAPDVRHARDRLEADPAAPVTLEELARECSLSRYQLLRAFARSYGLPPHAYLVQRRLAKARRLLRARVPLAQVAIDCGFSDQSHLSRCFVRQFGVTPGRYASPAS
jgi:AraC-like DNA-binding protein